MKVEKLIENSHKKILIEKNITLDWNLDLEIRPKNGIDSMSMVLILLDIEDEYGIILDDYLPEIRQCKTIRLLVEVIKKALIENGKEIY